MGERPHVVTVAVTGVGMGRWGMWFSRRRVLVKSLPVWVCLLAGMCFTGCSSGQQTVLLDNDVVETSGVETSVVTKSVDDVVLAPEDPVSSTTPISSGLVIPPDRLSRLEADVVHFFRTYRTAMLSLPDTDATGLIALAAPTSQMRSEVKMEIEDKRKRNVTVTKSETVTPFVQLGEVRPVDSDAVRVQSCVVSDLRFSDDVTRERMTVERYDWVWLGDGWKIHSRRSVAVYDSDSCGDFVSPGGQSFVLIGEKG
jgi:hypothetical protein